MPLFAQSAVGRLAARLSAGVGLAICVSAAPAFDGDRVTAFGARMALAGEARCAEGEVRVDGKCMGAREAISYCGPGYRPEGGACIPGYRAPDADMPLSAAQEEALAHGCRREQVWSEAEGCHEDD